MDSAEVEELLGLRQETPPNRIAAEARRLVAMGLQPVLVRARDKVPAAGTGWEKIEYSADQDLKCVFGPEFNLGVRLVAPLVDADLDSSWAMALAGRWCGRRSAATPTPA